MLGPGAGTRVECRVPGADANPYLAYAATLAAGLHGIENELELAPPFKGNIYEAEEVRDVPNTLRAALEALDTLGGHAFRRWATRWSTTTCTAAAGSRRSTTVG